VGALDPALLSRYGGWFDPAEWAALQTPGVAVGALEQQMIAGLDPSGDVAHGLALTEAAGAFDPALLLEHGGWFFPEELDALQAPTGTDGTITSPSNVR